MSNLALSLGFKTMTDDTEIRKDLFAWFGSAAYTAQCFEIELCILLLLLHRLKDPGLTSQELNRINIKLSKKTLGALLRDMRSQLDIHPEFETMLNDYLNKRNYLMHHFFFDHAQNLLSINGCQRMIEELKAMYFTLKEADTIAQKMSTNVRKHLGISEEEVYAWAEAHVREFTNTYHET